MEYFSWILFFIGCLIFVARWVSRRSYIMGAAHSMMNYTGIVNVKKRLDRKTGISYYYDMANDVFLFQTTDHTEAIKYLSKAFANSNMLVFSMEDIVDESI